MASAEIFRRARGQRLGATGELNPVILRREPCGAPRRVGSLEG